MRFLKCDLECERGCSVNEPTEDSRSSLSLNISQACVRLLINAYKRSGQTLVNLYASFPFLDYSLLPLPYPYVHKEVNVIIR